MAGHMKYLSYYFRRHEVKRYDYIIALQSVTFLSFAWHFDASNIVCYLSLCKIHEGSWTGIFALIHVFFSVCLCDRYLIRQEALLIHIHETYYSGTTILRRAWGLAKRGFIKSRLFSIYFTITGAKNIVRYTEDFVT